MDILNRYGVRRVAEIAAKVAKCRAALPVAATVPALIEAPETAPQTAAPVAIEVQTETRTPFVSRFPHLTTQHLAAQRLMFAAIKSANLPMNLSKRLGGINALLGTSFTSSTQLSPSQLAWVADAIQAGRFDADWNVIDVNVIDVEDVPFLVDAPAESELIETQTTPAPLESLDEIEMEFDLAQMRAANRARKLNDLRSRRVLLQTALIELDHAILTA